MLHDLQHLCFAAIDFSTIHLLIASRKWRLNRTSEKSQRLRIDRSIANWRNIDWILITRCLSITNTILFLRCSIFEEVETIDDWTANRNGPSMVNIIAKLSAVDWHNIVYTFHAKYAFDWWKTSNKHLLGLSIKILCAHWLVYIEEILIQHRFYGLNFLTKPHLI